MEDFEDSICCLEAEQDIIWDKNFLYKRNYSKRKNPLEPKISCVDAPDISALHQDWWMFDDIPF